MKTTRRAKEEELFCDFIKTYDENILEAKQQKFLKMMDIILAAFIVFTICMVSVRL
jgi:hypothetical protein